MHDIKKNKNFDANLIYLSSFKLFDYLKGI